MVSVEMLLNGFSLPKITNSRNLHFSSHFPELFMEKRVCLIILFCHILFLLVLYLLSMQILSDFVGVIMIENVS